MRSVCTGFVNDFYIVSQILKNDFYPKTSELELLLQLPKG